MSTSDYQERNGEITIHLYATNRGSSGSQEELSKSEGNFSPNDHTHHTFLELTKPERGISLWKQKPGVIHNWTNWTVEDSDILEVLYHGKLITVWLDYHTVKQHRGSNRRTKQDCFWSLGEGKDPKSSQAVRLSSPSGEARTRLPTHLHTKGAILNLTVKDILESL